MNQPQVGLKRRCIIRPVGGVPTVAVGAELAFEIPPGARGPALLRIMHLGTNTDPTYRVYVLYGPEAEKNITAVYWNEYLDAGDDIVIENPASGKVKIAIAGAAIALTDADNSIAMHAFYSDREC